MKRQAGFTALEMLGVLIVGLMILATIPKMIQDYSRAQQAKALATYVAEYNNAVARWLQDNRTALPDGTVNQAGPSWLQAVTDCGAPATAALNYLPCRFPNIAPFGVTVTTQIVTANPLITATSTFGPPIQFDGAIDQPTIAQVVTDARAGTNTRVSVSTNIDLVGNLIVAVADTNDPGDPWLRLDGTSVMEGDLNMGGNNIVNVVGIDGTGDWTTLGDVTANEFFGDDVTINSINEKASEGIYNVSVASNGTMIEKPTCPSGSGPQVFLAPFQFSGNVTAEPIGAVQAWATNAGTRWRANLRVLYPEPIGWVYPNATYGKMNAFVKCG